MVLVILLFSVLSFFICSLLFKIHKEEQDRLERKQKNEELLHFVETIKPITSRCRFIEQNMKKLFKAKGE